MQQNSFGKIVVFAPGQRREYFGENVQTGRRDNGNGVDSERSETRICFWKKFIFFYDTTQHGRAPIILQCLGEKTTVKFNFQTY